VRSRALSFSGADRNYILVAWHAPGSPATVLAHELAHLADRDDAAPAWFREGRAEYLAWFERGADGAWLAPPVRAHLARLMAADWLPLDRFQSAERYSPEFQAETFYAQSWLTIDWLARGGLEPTELRADLLEAEIAERGIAPVEADLKAYAQQRYLELPAAERHPELAASQTGGKPLEPWEWRLWLGEAHRELRHWEQAQAVFEELAAEHAGDPRLEAARGALAMDLGRYDEAEQLLRIAARAPAATARTERRYALMLLRPHEGGDEIAMGREAAVHARRAVELRPGVPSHLLTLAQAEMVARQWEASAGWLTALAKYPDWRERVAREFEELQRRRQQALQAVPAPRIAAGEQLWPRLIVSEDPPQVPPPPAAPAPAQLSPETRWPPSGTSIAVGVLSTLDCSGPERVIVLRHPLFSMRFRERPDRPPKLFMAPKGWGRIPCGAKGMLVNVAFRPAKAGKIRGDAVAVLF
jgi:tetratricopeptide (TPR) repeat protein